MRRFLLPALVVAAACGKDAPAPTPTAGSAGSAGSAGGAAPPPCQPLPFADATAVPEASGAAWVTSGGAPALLVVSDSGNDGAYGVIDAATGETRELGRLPLGEAGADIEGVAARGELVFGVTSSGWLRAWRREGAGYALAGPAYPLGPVDLPDTKGGPDGIGDQPPVGTGMVCGARVTNCGRNYEGLCLLDPAPAAPPAPGERPCVGFVASKADGHLYCLEEEAGRLRAVFARRIPIGRPGTLADCAFDERGQLWAGANLFDASAVYRVDGYQAPATATVTKVASLGVGFPEAIAVRAGVVYRLSDTGGAPSLVAAYRCAR